MHAGDRGKNQRMESYRLNKDPPSTSDPQGGGVYGQLVHDVGHVDLSAVQQRSEAGETDQVALSSMLAVKLQHAGAMLQDSGVIPLQEYDYPPRDGDNHFYETFGLVVSNSLHRGLGAMAD